MVLERVRPSDFSGPRAYVTDFDYKLVKFKRNRQGYRREVERKLKILFLTKNTIVCAASHLNHEFAYVLFKDNPILLNKRMIIPALREDKEHVVDYLNREGISRTSREDMIAFYREQVKTVVSWPLVDNSSWFKSSLLKELRTENSVIRRNLVSMQQQTLFEIVAEIESEPILSREFIIEIVGRLPRNEKRILLNFTNLVYHMSGARTVNCESALAQENYVDYSLADASSGKIILSETQIFWKIFLELAFETMLRENIPIELLDQLTFEDIFYMRKPIQRSSFQMKYDELVRKSIHAIEKNDPDDILFDATELLAIREKLSQGFRQTLESELPRLMRRKTLAHAKQLAKGSLSVGIGLAGFIPGVSTVANLVGLIYPSREILVNVNHLLKSRAEIGNYALYVRNKNRLLHEIIGRSSFSDKAGLLELVSLLAGTISSRVKI
jgi:hypothetical protein